MKISDISEAVGGVASIDMDNFFDVFTDRRGNYQYNLNQTLYFDASGASLPMYLTKCDLHPTIISYNIYGTPRLFWLICKLNGITDPSIKVDSGTPILYIPKESLGGIVEFMRD